MSTMVIIAVLVGVGIWAYKSGKRTGSRKGYNVGRAHGRRRRY